MRELLTTDKAAAEIGITPSQLRRIAKRRKYKTADVFYNKYSQRCALWSRRDMANIRRTNLYKEAIERNTKPKRCKEEIEAERQERLQSKYPNWRDAISPACEAMFSMNRYAKWRSCTQANREEIYDLKGDFIHLLCDEGYVTSISEHIRHLPSKLCLRCDGDGLDWNGNECERCSGSGAYRNEMDLRFIVFRFRVGETMYCWHQPEDNVWFSLPLTITPATNDDWNQESEKPLKMPSSQFATAKSLLRFVWAGKLAEREEMQTKTNGTNNDEANRSSVASE